LLLVLLPSLPALLLLGASGVLCCCCSWPWGSCKASCNVPPHDATANGSAPDAAACVVFDACSASCAAARDITAANLFIKDPSPTAASKLLMDMNAKKHRALRALRWLMSICQVPWYAALCS